MNEFKVGDRVRIRYLYDCCPYNNQIGTITWLHEYNFYPNGDISKAEKRVQGEILYDDGCKIAIDHMGSGIVSPVEKI